MVMIIREKNLEALQDSFVKVVVDLERKILALGCELHIDCAEELLKDGSKSEDLWGANVYKDDQRIDFVSLINIRPAAGNRKMEIENKEIRDKVEIVIKTLLF